MIKSIRIRSQDPKFRNGLPTTVAKHIIAPVPIILRNPITSVHVITKDPTSRRFLGPLRRRFRRHRRWYPLRYLRDTVRHQRLQSSLHLIFLHLPRQVSSRHLPDRQAPSPIRRPARCDGERGASRGTED